MAKEGSFYVYLWDNEEGTRFILQIENDVRECVIEGKVGSFWCINLIEDTGHFYSHRLLRKLIKRGTKII